MAMLPPPLIPDANQWIAARQAGYEHGEALRRRNLLLEAGQLAAAGGGVQPMAQPSPAATAQARSLGDRIRMAESGGRVDARNPNSSAYGPDQFISSTWLDVIKRHRPDIAAGKSDGELLALRSNAELSGQMRDAYTGENQNALRSAGLPVTDGTSYLSYFAGAGGARKALSADPSTPVSQLLSPSAIRANPFLQNMNAGDLRAWADRKAGAGGASAPVVQGAPVADPNAGLRNASNALLRGGELQAGLGIQNTLFERSEKARAQAEARHKEGQAIVGEMALRADTPEKWARLVETARAGGLNVAGLEDFSARELVLARAGKSMDYMSAGKRVFNKTTGQYVPVDPNAPTDVDNPDFSKNPVYGVDAQGNTVILQLNDAGGAGLTKLPEGVKVGKDPVRIDAGTETVLLDPVTRQVIGRVPKDVAGEAEQKKTGEGVAQRKLDQPAAKAALKNSASGLKSLFDKAAELKNAAGLSRATGVFQGGGWVPTVRQSTADAEAKLDTLKSKIAFGVLQAMRDASKTGGALGSIAVEELKMLQNNIASLDLRQGDEEFKKSLDNIMQYAQEAEERLLQGYQATYGQGGAPASAPPPTQETPAPAGDSGGFKVLRVR